jgi:serine acetyltransferase
MIPSSRGALPGSRSFGGQPSWVIMYTNATVLPVTICDHVVIGAGAVVTKDITVPGFYVGNPARLLRKL